MRTAFFALALFSPLLAQAAPANTAFPRVAVSQGISSPSLTSPVNFTGGFLYQNPAVASDFVRPYVSGEADTGNGRTGIGGELGLGSNSAGLAAGYYKPDCKGCGRFGAIGGVGGGAFAAGLGYHEGSTYSAGLILGPKSMHRFGLAADLHGSGSSVTSFGAGYSYHASQLIFAIDASRRAQGGSSATLITPGLEVMADLFALSVSYDAYLGDNRRAYQDQVWFGLGISGQRVHLALYHNYVNDWSAALTFLL